MGWDEMVWLWDEFAARMWGTCGEVDIGAVPFTQISFASLPGDEKCCS